MARHYLSNADVRKQRALNRITQGRGSASGRPVPKRRRVHQPASPAATAKATITGALAIIKGTVPASSGIDVSGTINFESPVVTVGTLVADATDNTFNAGALLINPDGTPVSKDDPDHTGEPPAPQVLDVRDVINPSYTDFIGEGPGVMVAGTVVEYEVGETTVDAFLLPTSEIRTRPEWDDTEPMAAYTDSDRAEKAGHGECEGSA